jgi:hypothetical protein
MTVEKLDELFDIEIEESEVETPVSEDAAALPPRTATTCALC